MTIKQKVVDRLLDQQETITEQCSMCWDRWTTDKEHPINVNGSEITLCCSCEDELLKKLAKARGINIKYGDGGEIDRIEITNKSIRVKR